MNSPERELSYYIHTQKQRNDKLGTVLHSRGEKYIQDSLHIVFDIFLNIFEKCMDWHGGTYL